MICTTIQNKTAEQILQALQRCEMAEIRLDRCELNSREMEEVFSSDVPLVATCRIAELMEREPSLRELPEPVREVKAQQIAEKRLVRAIEAGARYVDVELEAPKHISKRIRSAAHENGTVFIRSSHDFEGTGTYEDLKAVVEKCLYHGADIVKIVTTAHAAEDVERVMRLYEWCHNVAQAHTGTTRKGDRSVGELDGGGLIAFCMGEAGKQSRLECLRKGAPYTYAALTEDEAAAPGQWPMDEIHEAVYGDYKFIQPDSILEMPVSKSFAQRAIIAAALADGTSHLRGYSPCGDNEAALQVARNLGAQVEINGSELTITGISAQSGSVVGLCGPDGQPAVDADGNPILHVGESGLLTRMMIPVMAQLSSGPVTFTGEKTLLNRPLTGAREIMEAFGAQISPLATLGRNDKTGLGRNDKIGLGRNDKIGLGQNDNVLSNAPLSVPLAVSGPLNAGRIEISGKHGSQLISGLLMALPFAEKNSQLVVHDPKSIPYMFITLEVLKKFGIKIANDMQGGREFLESGGDWSLCTEMVFKVKGGQRYKAVDMDLEGDWSAAANFLVAGAIFGKAELAGLDTTSLQADLSIMDILMDAGASLSQLDGRKGNITVQRAPLRSFEVDASNCPDLFPIVAVLAAFCQGTSRVSGVGRLANKESDRAKAILEMLTQMGVKAEIDGDVLVVEGHSLTERLAGEECRCGLLKGGEYTSHHDHRMVMALKVASLGADGPITIDDEQCVAKSFPQFGKVYGEMLYRKM
jgi:3-phosphoshikimate 1-carboxyvinyltransferase